MIPVALIVQPNFKWCAIVAMPQQGRGLDMQSLGLKFEKLCRVIDKYESALVAFSGGIDSAFVLAVTLDRLGRNRVAAATSVSPSLARSERADVQKMVMALDVRHEWIETDEFQDENYVQNSSRRCFYCKTELYSKLEAIQKKLGLKTILNGTNADDLSDYRPGLEAADRFGVKSPLVASGITKRDVRELAKIHGLEIWNKPASPCLSSRIPYGHRIGEAELKQVETGEAFLKSIGFDIVRLRHFGRKARVELGKEEFIRLMDAGVRKRVTDFIRSIGFRTVVFEPYRQGRLNEAIH